LTPFDISQIQPRAWKILTRAYENDRVAGTYLFYGADGVGRWPLALAFAALLNCEENPRPKSDTGLPVPCGQCYACRNIFNLGFEGLFTAFPLPKFDSKDKEIDLTNEILEQKRQEPFKQLSFEANDSIRIDTARSIKKHLSSKASVGVRRVALFHQMEKMRAASADALLKMIEEPPADTVIILTTERPESLLPTIQSRSQVIRLDRIPPAAMENYLIEHYDLNPVKATVLARLAEGSLGKAVEMATTEDDDLSRRSVGFMLFKSLFVDSGAETISHLVDLVKTRDRGHARELLIQWQSLTADCNRYAATGNESDIVNVDFKSDLIRLSSYFQGSQPAELMVQAIKLALDDIALNVHIPGLLAALSLKLKAGIHRQSA